MRCGAFACLLDAVTEGMCAFHLHAASASEMRVPPHSTCGKCHRAIKEDDWVSRTMHQDKHKKTGSTRFAWQHYVCPPPTPRKLSRVAFKKSSKPLFADMLLDIE
jgi:hypothetical protein